jgi:hypothetical protein
MRSGLPGRREGLPAGGPKGLGPPETLGLDALGGCKLAKKLVKSFRAKKVPYRRQKTVFWRFMRTKRPGEPYKISKLKIFIRLKVFVKVFFINRFQAFFRSSPALNFALSACFLDNRSLFLRRWLYLGVIAYLWSNF